MKIEVSPASAASALADFLQRCDCEVVVHDDFIDVRPPDRTRTPDQARIEVAACLRVWLALNPHVGVTLESADTA